MAFCTRSTRHVRERGDRAVDERAPRRVVFSLGGLGRVRRKVGAGERVRPVARSE